MGHYFMDLMSQEEKDLIKYLPTVNDLLELMKGYADKPALSTLSSKLSYTELLREVAKRRAMLDEKGIPAGAHVAVLDRNTVDAIELFLAIMSSGRVVIMLPAAMNEMMLHGTVKKFDIAAVFARDEFSETTRDLSVPVFSTKETSEREADADKTVTAKTTAAIFFTGGTTGAPKGAVLSHGALMRGCYNGTFMPACVFDQRYYLILPMSHVFAAIRSCLSCLECGAEIYPCENMQAIFRELPIIKPTVLILVPGLCELLLGMAKARGKEILGGCLHTIISGAAPVPPRLMAAFRELNINLLAGYGLTESANFVAGNVDTDTRPDSVGKIYPEQEVRLVDGEIQVKGDNIFEGYYGNPELTKECFTEDGWFRTGDLGRFDEDGYLYITGRIKNLIILSNGENVSPEAVEEVFYRESLVKDCLVKEDSVNGSPVIALEVLPFGPAVEGLSKEEIFNRIKDMVAEVNKTLPTYMQVSKVSVRDTDFPRTPSMKIAR